MADNRRMTPTHRLCLIISVLVLAGCAAAPEYPPGVPQRVVFLDSDGFDRQIQGVLTARAETVEIPMLAPASVNSLPPRLGKVLSLVQDAGGKVTVQPLPSAEGGLAPRGLSLLGLIPALFEKMADLQQRQAFRDYDANVEVQDGRVTRVLLTKVR
jgi:hypothetical protein